MQISFNDLDLQDSVKKRILEVGFANPTEIQSKAIPTVLEGMDVLASSKTGSGKTGAFVIPMISLIVKNGISALILVPTRELATQVRDAIHNLRGENRIITSLILGGSDMRRQIDELKRKPNVIIATPGRLSDHIYRKTVRLESFGMLILDEFDRMLDMGFKDEIKKIVAHLPENRHTLMFSATIRKSILDSAKEYLKENFKQIIVENKEEENKNIKQEFVNLSRNEKYAKLIDIIDKNEGTIIVFTGTKRMADELSERLRGDGHTAIEIHGDLRQGQRHRAIKDFRSKICRILVATDVAARGLDVPHVEFVVNYDMPNNPEDYTHRIGRTGRAGQTGTSISFITSSDSRIYKAITLKQNSDQFESKFSNKKPARGDYGDRSGFKSKLGRFGSESRNDYNRKFGHRSDFSDRRPSYGRNNEDARESGEFGFKPRRNFNSDKREEGGYNGSGKSFGRRNSEDFGDNFNRFDKKPRGNFRSNNEFGHKGSNGRDTLRLDKKFKKD